MLRPFRAWWIRDCLIPHFERLTVFASIPPDRTGAAPRSRRWAISGPVPGKGRRPSSDQSGTVGQFQYSRFRSSIGWVIRLCRDCCIRSTLFMHSTALLARNVLRAPPPPARNWPVPARPTRARVPLRGPIPSADPRAYSAVTQPPTPRHRLAPVARGSADSNRRCIRSRNARLRGSFRKLRTFDQSGPVSSFSAAAISASAAARSLSRPSDRTGPVPRGHGPRPTRAAGPVRTPPGPGPRRPEPLRPGPPRASIPCRFAPATLASAASAFSHAASATPVRARTRRLLVVWKTSRPCSSAGADGSSRGLSPTCHRRGDPLGGVGDGEFQPSERGQFFLPGLGRAVGGVAAEDGRHARRFDPTKVGRPQKRSRQWRESRRGGHMPGRSPPDHAGALGLGLDPAAEGRMVGNLGLGQEHAQEFFDLSQAQAHGEGGGGELPLLVLVEAI